MLKKPEQCCDIGTYGCDIPMPIARRVEWIDFCIADIVAALNAANIKTIASCCGHAKMDGSVLLEDGREIVVRVFQSEEES